MQRADDTVAVRNGTVVFRRDGTVRAAVTASWYRQMGFPDVSPWPAGRRLGRRRGARWPRGWIEPVEPLITEAKGRVRRVSPAELASALAGAQPPVALYVDTSDRFAAGHVPGARWLPRGWLELRVSELVNDTATPIVVTDEDGDNATLGAATLLDLGYRQVSALTGGTEAWRKEGRPVEHGLTGVVRSPDDVVPAGPDRSFADMINYLRWEERLGHKYAPAR